MNRNLTVLSPGAESINLILHPLCRRRDFSKWNQSPPVSYEASGLRSPIEKSLLNIEVKLLRIYSLELKGRLSDRIAFF